MKKLILLCSVLLIGSAGMLSAQETVLRHFPNETNASEIFHFPGFQQTIQGDLLNLPDGGFTFPQLNYLKKADDDMWLLDSTYGYEWDTTANDWFFKNRLYAFYDSRGNLIKMLSSSREKGTTEWINSNMFIYAYDENNNIIESVSYSWDTNQNDWVYTSKTTYAYSTNSTERISYSWDTDNNDWIDPGSG